MKNVSLKTIASEIGVSINTVSRALRDMDDISPEMKAKIRKKAIEMGYMPNQIAQALKHDEQPVVAVHINSFDNLYFNMICSELSKCFKERKEYNLMFIYSDSDNDPQEVVKQCILQRVDLLVTHMHFPDKTMELAQINNISVVHIGENSSKNADVVTVNEDMGCHLAARYLSLYHDTSKYLYVGIGYYLSRARYRKICAEMEEINGREVKYFDFEQEDISTLCSYIGNGYRRIFFYNDALAYQALDRLNKLVVDIRTLYPDLHLVGFDGLCEAIPGFKQISTVKIDFPQLADGIYEVIGQRLNDPKAKPQCKTVPVTLHQRRLKEG